MSQRHRLNVIQHLGAAPQSVSVRCQISKNHNIYFKGVIQFRAFINQMWYKKKTIKNLQRNSPQVYNSPSDFCHAHQKMSGYWVSIDSFSDYLDKKSSSNLSLTNRMHCIHTALGVFWFPRGKQKTPRVISPGVFCFPRTIKTPNNRIYISSCVINENMQIPRTMIWLEL